MMCGNGGSDIFFSDADRTKEALDFEGVCFLLEMITLNHTLQYLLVGASRKTNAFITLCNLRQSRGITVLILA
jgi:hypothetical protein